MHMQPVSSFVKNPDLHVQQRYTHSAGLFEIRVFNIQGSKRYRAVPFVCHSHDQLFVNSMSHLSQRATTKGENGTFPSVSGCEGVLRDHRWIIKCAKTQTR